MKKLLVVTILLGLIQGACTRTQHWSESRWAGQGPIPVAPMQKQEAISVTPEKEFIFQTQKIEDVEVEGSFYKEISENGRIEFVDYHWMSKIPLSVRRDLVLMRAQKPFVLPALLKKHPSMNGQKVVTGPSLSLPFSEKPEVFWKLVFEQEDGILHEFLLDKDFTVVNQRQLGSHFISATANLFPKGPLKSDLQQVVIQGLLNSKELASNAVKISTEANLIASPGENNDLKFDPNDLRFSQVQVFFYITQALDWFGKNFSFHLPFVLEAETQKGFPDKTNTAFYFQHKIRLGDGDGEFFDKIPMDPSVVTHETMHAVIEAVAGLPYEGQGGSLNEAFADYLTAVQLNNPKMGEAAYKKAAFKRTIENDLAFSETDGGLYHDSGIVSGLLWSLNKELGSDKGISLAWQTLLRLNRFSDLAAFKQEILSVLEKETPETQKKARQELKRRGWLE